jgi:hypothetical protein
MGMSQSEWIAVAIVAGFLVYLAIKGKLATYWTMLTGGGAASSAAGGVAGAVAGAAGGAATSSAAGAVAGAVAGPAATTLPGVVSGTVTQGQQTTQEYFPMIAGAAGITMPSVTF